MRKITLLSVLRCVIVLLTLGCGALSMKTATDTPIASPPGTLQDALKSIHDQFEIDPAKGYYGIPTPYSDYHRGLQQMTVLLLNDPRAQTLSLTEREALFEKVAGFDGARFIAGNGKATLVSLRTYRGHNPGGGGHYSAPDALHVVDQQGTIYDLGTGGLLKQTWWVDNRWIVLFRLKLDASSGPTRWAIWHVGQADDVWQQMVEFEILPTPYNHPTPYDFELLPLRFEEGYRVMIADVTHWEADDPCEFSAEFTDTYKHGYWQVRRMYRLTGDTYELVSSEVLTFTVQHKGTGEQVAIDWQAYCTGPVR
jgi:hypothetical protein